MTRDGMAEPVSPDQIFSRERGQGHTHFPCLADHEQDWQPCPVDLYSVCVHAHIYDDNPLLKTIYPRFILLSLQFTAFGKTPCLYTCISVSKGMLQIRGPPRPTSMTCRITLSKY